jgi:hypothetical protein
MRAHALLLLAVAACLLALPRALGAAEGPALVEGAHALAACEGGECAEALAVSVVADHEADAFDEDEGFVAEEDADADDAVLNDEGRALLQTRRRPPPPRRRRPPPPRRPTTSSRRPPPPRRRRPPPPRRRSPPPARSPPPPPPSPPPPPPPETGRSCSRPAARRVLMGSRLPYGGAGGLKACSATAVSQGACCQRCVDDAACNGWMWTRPMDCRAQGQAEPVGVCYLIDEYTGSYESGDPPGIELASVRFEPASYGRR